MVKLGSASRVVLIVAAVILLTALTIFGAIWVSNIDNRKAASAYPKCAGKHTAHEVKFEHDKVVPAHTTAKRCDTLTITNLDSKPRIVAFGVRDKHVAYDGVSERYLSEKGSFSVTLVQPGTFRFHDHVQEAVGGTFTVSR